VANARKKVKEGEGARELTSESRCVTSQVKPVLIQRTEHTGGMEKTAQRKASKFTLSMQLVYSDCLYRTLRRIERAERMGIIKRHYEVYKISSRVSSLKSSVGHKILCFHNTWSFITVFTNVYILRMFFNRVDAFRPFMSEVHFILSPHTSVDLSSEFSTRDVSIKMHYHVPIANYTLQPSQPPFVNHPELVCSVCQY
jgi:hypothetical protein